MQKKSLYALAAMRILLGWTFFWAFIDKVFGLGFTTTAEQAWLNGGSPTSGFLLHGTKGPFASAFQALAGSPFVDVLFMAGLCLIGLALILGIGIRIACATGSIMLALMFLAVLLPEHNPIVDEHVIYVAALAAIAFTPDASGVLGLGNWWKNQPLVKRFPWLA